MKSCLPRPLELEILHHYYVSAAEFPRADAPACKEALRWLRENNLLSYNPVGERPEYKITDRGVAHIKALLCVPLPVQRWETDWNSI